MLWVIENGGFVSGDILLESLKKLNKDFVLWNDDFWKTKEYESFDKTAIFHGSLGNASKIKKEIKKPKKVNLSAFCKGKVITAFPKIKRLQSATK